MRFASIHGASNGSETGRHSGRDECARKVMINARPSKSDERSIKRVVTDVQDKQFMMNADRQTLIHVSSKTAQTKQVQ